MLRAALIGFGSSGKSTLFQLMTSVAGNRPRGARQGRGVDRHLQGARRAARPADRDVQPEKARAGDGRVLRPRRARPAPAAPRRSSTSSAYKNADALVHVLRAFHDPAVPHPSGSIDPARDAQAMEDELILADLGVAERRLERLEKDLKKGRTPELERERDVLIALPGRARRGAAAARARPARATTSSGCAAFSFSRPSRCSSSSTWTKRSSRTAAMRRRRRRATGLTAFLSRAATARRRRSARRSSSRSRSSRPADAAAFLADLGLAGIGARSRDSRQLRSARLHVVLHRRRGRMPRLVDSARHAGAARGRRNPQRHRARLHPRRGRQLRSPDRRAASMAACRDHGEVRLEGKEYIVQDGDIINFRFAT